MQTAGSNFGLHSNNELNSPTNTDSFANAEFLSKSVDANERKIDSFMGRFRYGRTGSEDSSNNAFEHAFISSIYNAVAILILAACIGLCVILLILLQPFVRPIFWAILTSAFLFAFKRYLTKLTRDRLSDMEARNAFLFFELLFLPFQLVDYLIEFIWSFLKAKLYHLVALIASIILFNLVDSFYVYLVSYFFSAIETIVKIADSLIYYSDNSWQLTLVLLVAYMLGIAFYWSEANTILFQILSLPVWLSVLFHVSTLMGAFRPFFVFLFILLGCLGFVSLLNEFLSKVFLTPDESEADNEANTDLNEPKLDTLEVSKQESSFEKFWYYLAKFSRFYLLMFTTSKPSTKPKEPETSKLRKSSTNQHRLIRKKTNSDKYFMGLFWLFLAVTLRIDMYVTVPLIVLVWKLIKHALSRAYRFVTKGKQIEPYRDFVLDWTRTRASALMPKPFTLLLTVFIKGDHKVNKLLQKSMDNLISGLMIISLLVFALLSFVLLGMKVQSESFQLISFMSNILNDNVYSKPELRGWLPEKEKLTNIYQTAINNFYYYGREWLSGQLKSSLTLNNKNDTKSLILEAQILEHWDNLYAYIVRKTSDSFSFTKMNLTVTNSTNSNLPPLSIPSKNSEIYASKTVKANSIKSNWWNTYMKLTGENFDYKAMMLIVKDNLGILISIGDSLFSIVKGNIHLLSTIVFAILSMIFSSGFALMNFFFSFIVYITAMFYILSISVDLYKPLQWINEIKLFRSDLGNGGQSGTSDSSSFYKTIEESIRSVFVASFKMVSFYGLYTYSIYSLFNVNVVYLPSIAAGFLGFLPILGTYWTSLPGILELWLIQDSPIYAIVFFVLNILPSYFVDNAVYSEIEAGHPYLTGLAFAGGVYCLGLEGAIIGPIVLCLLIVITKIIKSATKNNFNKLFRSNSFIN